MLYATYEMRRALHGLGGGVLDMQARALRGLPSPFGRSYGVRVALAATEVHHALRLTHDRPDFGVDSVSSGEVGIACREEVVTRTPFASLVHFRKADASPEGQPKVLVVPGLAGHFATLVRGTVATMLRDHDVYVADWHNARDIPADAGPFDLDDYVAHLVDFLREIGPGTHLMAVCQPAVACLVAAAVMEEDEDPARPGSLILLAGPVDTRVNPSRVSRFAERQPLSVLERMVLHKVPPPFRGAGRRVYPGFLQVGGFMGMDPRRHVEAFRALFGHLVRDGDGDRAAAQKTLDFYAEYFAVLDIAGEFYLDTAQRVFKENHLPQGRFTWRGRRVDPSRITSALLTIEGAMDEMCTPGQTQAAHALCAGIPRARRRHVLQDGVGHYGVFAGSTFENEIYPQVRGFVADVALAHAVE